MTVFDLRGTAAQNALVQSALDVCDFPFDRLLPSLQREGKQSINVDWQDLSRYATDDGKGHSHVHEGDSTAHPIERVVEGRRRVLGLFYLPPHTRVVLDLGLESRPDLAREVFLAEAAHAVDYHFMSRDVHRAAVVNAVHREQLLAGYEVRDGVAINLDGHTCSWFDVGAYADWVGETFMEAFIRSFAPSVPVTIRLNHPVSKKAATRIRWAVIEPDLFGTVGGKAYHRGTCPFIRVAWLAHKKTWATPEDAVMERRPCKVCKPPKSTWPER